MRINEAICGVRRVLPLPVCRRGSFFWPSPWCGSSRVFSRTKTSSSSFGGGVPRAAHAKKRARGGVTTAFLGVEGRKRLSAAAANMGDMQDARRDAFQAPRRARVSKWRRNNEQRTRLKKSPRSGGSGVWSFERGRPTKSPRLPSAKGAA